MTKARVLEQSVDRFATGVGFERQGESWYREDSDIVWVLTLERAEQGRPHDVGIGLWFSELGAESRPKAESCHVRSRLSRLVADAGALESLLALDARVDEEVLRAEVAAVLEAVLRPLLERVRAAADLASSEAGGFLRHGQVAERAHRLIPPR